MLVDTAELALVAETLPIKIKIQLVDKLGYHFKAGQQ